MAGHETFQLPAYIVKHIPFYGYLRAGRPEYPSQVLPGKTEFGPGTFQVPPKLYKIKPLLGLVPGLFHGFYTQRLVPDITFFNINGILRHFYARDRVRDLHHKLRAFDFRLEHGRLKRVFRSKLAILSPEVKKVPPEAKTHAYANIRFFYG